MINEITTSTALSSLGIQEWVLTGEPTNQESFEECFGKVTGVDANGNGIVSHDPDDFGVTWAEVNSEISRLNNELPMKELREERDRLLTETDWWALSDVNMQLDHRQYRQALRDMTEGNHSKTSASWPVKPADPVGP